MTARPLFIAALLALATAHAETPAGTDHLLSAARLFRAGNFAEAVVEFKVAERLGAGAEATLYLAVALSRAGRHAEALEAFARTEAQGVAVTDALVLYYRALSCHHLRLYVAADNYLAAVESGGGPKISEQARGIRSEIAAHLAKAIPTAALDWHHAEAAAAEQRGWLLVSALYFDEALQLARRRADGYRSEEAQAGRRRVLASAPPPAPTP